MRRTLEVGGATAVAIALHAMGLAALDAPDIVSPAPEPPVRDIRMASADLTALVAAWSAPPAPVQTTSTIRAPVAPNMPDILTDGDAPPVPPIPSRAAPIPSVMPSFAMDIPTIDTDIPPPEPPAVPVAEASPSSPRPVMPVETAPVSSPVPGTKPRPASTPPGRVAQSPSPPPSPTRVETVPIEAPRPADFAPPELDTSETVSVEIALTPPALVAEPITEIFEPEITYRTFDAPVSMMTRSTLPTVPVPQDTAIADAPDMGAMVETFQSETPYQTFEAPARVAPASSSRTISIADPSGSEPAVSASNQPTQPNLPSGQIGAPTMQAMPVPPAQSFAPMDESTVPALPVPASSLATAQTNPPRQSASPSVATPATTAPSVDIGALRAGYSQSLRALIESRKVYPNRAKRRRIEGIVEVRFSLDASGAVLSASLSSASGQRLLDDAALDLIRNRIGRFLAPPPELGPGPHIFTLPIRYEMR